MAPNRFIKKYIFKIVEKRRKEIFVDRIHLPAPFKQVYKLPFHY